MTLPTEIKDREFQKFEEVGSDVTVMTTGSASSKTQIVDSSGNVISSQTLSDGTTKYAIITHDGDSKVTGTMAALNAAVTATIGGFGSCVMNVSGTWSGKILIEGTVDDTTWTNLSVVQPAGGMTRNGIQNDNQNGNYRLVMVSGYTKLRTRMSEYTSGTATIVFNFSASPATTFAFQLEEANLLTTANMNAYRSSDSSYQPIRLDKATNTLQVIDYAHHEIHAGSSFYFHEVLTLTNAATQDYVITTPNTTKWPHMGVECDFNNGAGTIELYEGTDKNGTTPQTVFNRDRNSLTTATTTIHKGQSGGTTDGTRILWKSVGSGKTSGGISGTAEERILKQNTKYILRLTNDTNTNNKLSLILRWYEHTNIA